MHIFCKSNIFVVKWERKLSTSVLVEFSGHKIENPFLSQITIINPLSLLLTPLSLSFPFSLLLNPSFLLSLFLSLSLFSFIPSLHSSIVFYSPLSLLLLPSPFFSPLFPISLSPPRMCWREVLDCLAHEKSPLIMRVQAAGRGRVYGVGRGE